MVPSSRSEPIRSFFRRSRNQKRAAVGEGSARGRFFDDSGGRIEGFWTRAWRPLRRNKIARRGFPGFRARAYAAHKKRGPGLASRPSLSGSPLLKLLMVECHINVTLGRPKFASPLPIFCALAKAGHRERRPTPIAWTLCRAVMPDGRSGLPNSRGAPGPIKNWPGAFAPRPKWFAGGTWVGPRRLFERRERRRVSSLVSSCRRARHVRRGRGLRAPPLR